MSLQQPARTPSRLSPNDALRRQVFIRNNSTTPTSTQPPRDPRVPAGHVHPALRTYRESPSVKPVLDILNGENNLNELVEIWFQILQLHFAPQDGYRIRSNLDTPEEEGLQSRTVIKPGIGDAEVSFFAIVCSTAVHDEASMARVRAAAELRRLLSNISSKRWGALRGAVAVGNSVQFYNWGADGKLSVFPWATHPFDIYRDHIAVQGCLDYVVDNQ